MHLIIAGIAGFLAFSVVAFMPMAAILTGGAAAQAQHQKLGSGVFWGGTLLALVVAVLQIWGQMKFWHLEDGETELVALALMFSSIPIVAIFSLTVYVMFKVMDKK